jgi:serine/threonine-protein phosphatase 2A regulatory subunit A
MMSDAVFTIREESTTTILKLSEKFYGKDWLMDIIDRKLDELVKHERFMLRIQSIHLINKMWEVVSDDYVNRRFAEILIEMTTDPVPNIRFNVCKTLLAVYPRLSA